MVQLYDAASATELWTRTYSEPEQNLTEFRRNIVQSVGSTLEPSGTGVDQSGHAMSCCDARPVRSQFSGSGQSRTSFPVSRAQSTTCFWPSQRMSSTVPTAPNTEVQEQILNIYKNQPETSILLELMIDFDEGLQEWRYRHVKLTDRTIGNHHGPGGSSGIEYL